MFTGVPFPYPVPHRTEVIAAIHQPGRKTPVSVPVPTFPYTLPTTFVFLLFLSGAAAQFSGGSYTHAVFPHVFFLLVACILP
jgi:hypothetical protein